jgi:hypothetical protein
VLALSSLLLVLQLTGKDTPPAMGLAGPEPGIPAPEVARRSAVILGWIVGYLVAIWLLGFTLGGALCTFLSLKVGSRERWPVTLAMTAGMAAFIEILFVRALHVPFPPGQMLVWLGVT